MNELEVFKRAQFENIVTLVVAGITVIGLAFAFKDLTCLFGFLFLLNLNTFTFSRNK